MKKYLKYIKNHKFETFIVILILLISGFAHGINMFHFPYYENDEGAYMSQAWAVITEGQLSPYTYWYDHAPAGWLFIALWVKLTGGFNTFGFSINSGRVFMLVLHLLSSLFLYYIAKRLTGKMYAGIIAVLIFSLSPLGIYFQRRVLLDNIMTFWVLLAFALLVKKKIKLRHVIISALSFAIGVLSKENAIFFIPGFLYLIYAKVDKRHRNFAFIKWIIITIGVISLYPLYALLKGEFFPVGFLGNNAPHVSLLSSWMDQLSRGSTLPFWNHASDFYVNFQEWISRDQLTIIAGIIATIVSVIFAIKNTSFRIVAFFSVFFWLFLLRGKLIIDFYIVPLIPFLALSIGMAADRIISFFTFKQKLLMLFLNSIVIVSISFFLFTHNIGQWTKDETAPQLEALHWIFTHVPKNANIAIDEYAEVEFRQSGYNNAAWFWKMWSDPQIQEKYNYDWRNIHYLLLTHEMLKQIGSNLSSHYDPIRNVLLNANQAVMFGPTDKGTYVNIPQYKTTNGDWAAVYELKPKQTMILDASWNYYKTHFIHSYGQVIDPSNGNTTSEGQSYAMLRAVLENDQTSFDGIWQWTHDHLQYRTHDKLFSWLWTKKGNTYQVGDSASATDADEDIALSLILAYNQWGDQKYLTAAKPVIADIWQNEVVQINGHYYLTSGSGAKRPDGYLVNPSYLSPATYRTFAIVDKTHPWNALANDSYYLLNTLGSQPGNTTYLPPNWILVTNNGDITSAKQYIADSEINNYGFDAFRTMWRVALDAQWFHNTNAFSYLNKVAPFFVGQWNQNKSFAAIYDQNGNKEVNYQSLSTDAGALAVFTITNKNLANEVYKQLFESKYNFSGGYWGDKNNYYDQNWAWFASELLNGFNF